MRHRSPKRAAQMRAYIPAMRAYLDEHTRCEFPGCIAPSAVLHHRRGRRGARLLDQQWWAAACHAHNQFAEDETGAALACGWLVRIEGAA